MAKETKTMRNMFHLSFGEEVGNAITHGVMAILCLFFLPFAVRRHPIFIIFIIAKGKLCVNYLQLTSSTA